MQSDPQDIPPLYLYDELARVQDHIDGLEQRGSDRWNKPSWTSSRRSIYTSGWLTLRSLRCSGRPSAKRRPEMAELILHVCPVCEKPISLSEGAEAWCSISQKGIPHRPARLVKP